MKKHIKKPQMLFACISIIMIFASILTKTLFSEQIRSIFVLISLVIVFGLVVLGIMKNASKK